MMEEGKKIKLHFYNETLEIFDKSYEEKEKKILSNIPGTESPEGLLEQKTKVGKKTLESINRC